MKDRIAKLPKWAREYISILNSKNEILQEELNRLQSTIPFTKFSPYIELGSRMFYLSEYSRVFYPLRKNKIQIQW